MQIIKSQFSFLETLAEERSKVKDAKKQDVPVILKEFLAGVKTEGVVSMVKQHTISDWGREPDNKIQKARAAAEQNGGGLKSSGEYFSLYSSLYITVMSDSTLVTNTDVSHHSSYQLKTRLNKLEGSLFTQMNIN